MDNNVLASPQFVEIIDEIKAMGFYKGATFVEPNQFEIAIKNLKEGFNDIAFIKKCFYLLNELLTKRIKNKDKAEEFRSILDSYHLLNLKTTTKDNLINSFPELNPLFEKYRDKTAKARYVDFSIINTNNN